MVHHSKFLYSALVVSAMAVGANAQVTTSAISGKVLDETKAPVIGATVVAIHEPSGTLYGAVTNVDGRYTIQGMRTGGPYKIEISYVGYNKTAFTGISLELGNTLSLNAEMKPKFRTVGRSSSRSRCKSECRSCTQLLYTENRKHSDSRP